MKGTEDNSIKASFNKKESSVKTGMSKAQVEHQAEATSCKKNLKFSIEGFEAEVKEKSGVIVK